MTPSFRIFQAVMAIELSSNSQKLSMWTSEVSMKPLSMLQKRLKVT